MACLVMLMRREGEDPDDGMCWQRGDPVDVLEYDSRLGECETPVLSDNFIGLILLDIDRDRVHEELIAPPDGDVVQMLRAYNVHIDELPSVARAQMEAYGTIEMTCAQVRPYVRHRITGETW